MLKKLLKCPEQEDQLLDGGVYHRAFHKSLRVVV